MTRPTELASVWHLRWLAYALAIALPVAVMFARLAMGFTIGERPTLILFVVPIILSAYLGGLGPGLVCTMMAALLSNLFLLAPSRAFPLVAGIESVQWVTMIVAGALVRGLNEARHRPRVRPEADQKLLAVTLASIGDAVITTDIKGRVTFLNAVAERLTGWTSRDAVGQPLISVLRIVDEDTRQPAHDPAQTVLRGGTVVGLAGHTILLARDGREIPIDHRGAPIKQADGSVQGVVLVFRDYSEQKQAEKAASELRAMEEEKRLALEANRMKGEFLANMSHELRTPLNAIIGFTGTLLMKLPGPLNAEQEKQLGTVQSGAQHLLALINDLLDLAKIESGKVELSLAPVDCREVINEVAESLRPQAAAKGLELTVTVPQVLTVRSDRRALSQIVINLTNNAIKFTERGSVRIRAGRCEEDGGKRLEISVEDTGIGIRPDDQKKLFGAFTQVDDSTHRRYEGTGLGLHLSQKLAEALGGRIELESEYGRGSTFALVLQEK